MENLHNHFMISLFVLMFLAVNTFAQTSSVEIGYPHAYPGIDNDTRIILENIPCDELYIKAQKGLILQKNKPCCFTYRAKLAGEEFLDIHRIQKDDTTLIEQRRIIVRKWPEQPAEYGNIQSGEMSKSMFIVFGEVTARFYGLDISGFHKVKSYNISVLRSGNQIFTAKNNGGKIEPENLAKLKVIKTNDIIKFSKIYAFIVGEIKPRKLNDIIIKLKD